MARRTAATIRRPGPHRYREDPAAPGTCQQCHLIEANGVHDDDAAAQAENEAATRRAERDRRLGERD